MQTVDGRVDDVNDDLAGAVEEINVTKRALETTQSNLTLTSEALTAEIKRAKDVEVELNKQGEDNADAIDALNDTADGLSGRLETAETKINATSRGLSLEVTRATDAEGELSGRITATANEFTSKLASKVGNDEVISVINQTPGNVTIDANKINLNGAVSANNHFKITNNGSVEIDAGTINLGNGKFIADSSGNVTALSFTAYGSLICYENYTITN